MPGAKPGLAAPILHLKCLCWPRSMLFLLTGCSLGCLMDGGTAWLLQAATHRSSESPSATWLFHFAVLCFRKSPNIDPKQHELRCFLMLEQAAGLQAISLW